MDRIGLVVHPRRDLGRALDTVGDWAAAQGAEVFQVRIDGQERVVADAGDAATADLIIALGGDGTALAALHAAAPHDVPVLGVACGSLGALTATTADELDEALDAVAAGRWERRTLPGLSVTGEGAPPLVAINDLVVIRRGASQIVVGIRVDDELYVRFAGDGIVVATPLGSSAYTMAAGGPIVAPESRGYAVTPLAPHGGCCPPLVVGDTAVVTLEIAPGHGGSRIELDGQIRELQPHRLEVTWRSEYASLVMLGDQEPLLAGLRRRRILMDSPRLLARDDRAAATTRR
jgi:NAD+ kinase